MLSLFPSAFAREPVKSITLADLIELIRCETWLHEILSLRESLAAGNRAAYDAAKRLLPAVMLSGSVRTRSTAAPEEDRAITHSGYLQADLDAKDHPHLTLVEMAALVRKDKHVLAAFVSPSGLGLKAIIRIPADSATHRAAFDAAAKHFAKLGLKLDPATKDPGRLCFVSHDPDAWLRENATILKPSNRPAKSPHIPAGSLSATARDIREMLAFIPPRPAYQDWLRIASAIWSVLDEAEGSALLAAWSPEERAGEYARKYPQRLQHIHIGTLAWYAKLHGFDATSSRKTPTPRPGKTYEKSSTTAADPPPPVSPDPVSDPHFLEFCLRQEQRGDALLWQIIARGTHLYDHFTQGWRVWRNGCWERDDFDAVKLGFAEALTLAYQHLVESGKQQLVKSQTKQTTDTAHQLLRLARQRIDCLNRIRYLTGSLELARSMPDLATRSTAFDRAPHLLAVENGVIDFEAGTFREAQPADMLTHRAAVRYDPAADCPLFRAFMHRMLVDPEVVSFVMRAMAYSCTGLVDADVLFFLYGKGANGKSTFMMVFKLLLGELMTTIDVETLLTRRPDTSLDYKKASLEGRRVAVTDEVPAGRKLSESMIKALIGGDEIVARRPYEKPYTFAPTHKLWMVGNHKPVIEGTDAGIWRRICLIPWTQTIPVKERRPRAQVVAGFREELPGILNWILAAWQEFRQLGGLAPPRAVQQATEEYQTEQDQLGSFIEERTSRQTGASLPAQRILKAYHDWCEANGERPICRTSKLLLTSLRERGFESYRGHGNTTSIRDLKILTTELFDH